MAAHAQPGPLQQLQQLPQFPSHPGSVHPPAQGPPHMARPTASLLAASLPDSRHRQDLRQVPSAATARSQQAERSRQQGQATQYIQDDDNAPVDDEQMSLEQQVQQGMLSDQQALDKIWQTWKQGLLLLLH